MGIKMNGHKTAYEPQGVHRIAFFRWNAGRPIYQLVDDQGCEYVMQSLSNTKNADLTIQNLENLGDVLALPTGWRFETSTPTEDISIIGVDGTTDVLQDDLDNSYSLKDNQPGCTLKEKTCTTLTNQIMALNAMAMGPAKMQEAQALASKCGLGLQSCPALQQFCNQMSQ